MFFVKGATFQPPKFSYF